MDEKSTLYVMLWLMIKHETYYKVHKIIYSILTMHGVQGIMNTLIQNARPSSSV